MGFDGAITATLNFTFTFAGLAMVAAGLAWQAIERGLVIFVRVELLAGATDSERVVTGPMKAFDEDRLTSQGFHELLFVVRATNIGRKAVEVIHWKILTSRGWGYSLDGFHLNPKLPYRLEPGSAVYFYVPMEQVIAASYAAYILRGMVNEICASIRFGSGAVRRSKMHELPALSRKLIDSAESAREKAA